MNRLAAMGLALGLAALSSCRTTPDTGVRLEVFSEIDPMHTISRVHVRTYDSTDVTNGTIDEHDFTIGPSATSIPFSMFIAPRDLAHPTSHLGIEVTGFEPAGPPLVARAHLGFIPGRIVVLGLVLREGCTSCNAPQTCNASRMCVDPMIDPNLLPVYGQPFDAGTDALDAGPDGLDAGDDVAVAVDAIDAIDATDAVDVPPRVDVLGMMCPADGGMRYCPAGYNCGGMLGGPPGCCNPMPGVHSCSGISCAFSYMCMVDPMGNAACCGPPLP